MDDIYVASLEFENGQLSLNEETLQSLTLAKIENIKQTILEKMYTDLKALADKEATDAADELTASEIALNEAVIGGIEAAQAGAAAWRAFAAEQRAAAGVSGSQYDTKANEIIQATYNRLQALDSVANEIRAGGMSMRTTMGAGSKSSSSKADQKDYKGYLEDVVDRYHDINQAIEHNIHMLNMLSKQQEHLAGGSLIASLKKQNELLEAQTQNYKNLNAELKVEQSELQSKLSAYGANFKSNGFISNYAETFDAIRDQYNDAIASYNSAVNSYNSMSKSQQDATGKANLDKAEETLKVAEKAHNKAQEDLSRYDEVIKEIQDSEEELQELVYQMIENNLQIFELEIQLTLDLDEAKRQINNFLKEIDSNFKKIYKGTDEWMKRFTAAVKNVKTYTDEDGTITTRLKEVQEIQDIINNPNYAYGTAGSMFVDRSEAITKLQEYTNELMDEGKELYDLYKETWEEYLQAIDEVKDQWDDILDGFDRIDDTLNHYQKVIELLYGGRDAAAGRELLDQYYNAAADNSLAKQGTLRQEIDALRDQYDQILALGGDETDEDLQKLTEAIQDAEGELENEIENYLDIIQNRLTNSIKTIMDTANKAMTQGYGIDTTIERWNDAKDAADGYYDEVERVYQLEKLESEWENVINSSNSLKAQQYLTDMMDSQLNNLREKTKLSEYDIELAEKELAIYQAQMALEDARNNKNSMKLVRNEQGNWAYQYVADEGDVAAKEEEMLRLLYERYEFVKNSSQEATEALLELYQTAQERLTELMEEYTNADAERRAEIEEEYEYLYNYYYGEDGLIIQKAAETTAMQDDLNIAAMELLWDLYETDQENFDLMTENEKALIDDLRDHSITSFEDLTERIAGDGGFYDEIKDKCTQVNEDNRTSWQQLATDIIKEWATDPASVQNVITKVYDNIMDAVAKYDNAIIRSEQISGIAWSNVAAYIDNATAATYENLYAVESVIQATGGLYDFASAVATIENQWYNVAGAIATAVSALEGFLSLLGESTFHGNYPAETGEAITSKMRDYMDNAINDVSNAFDGTSGSGGNSSGQFHLTASSDDGRDNFSLSYSDEQSARSQLQAFESLGLSGSLTQDTNDKKRKVIEVFDTGGYTGSWSNDSGRLAFLHQKELVLNQDDTTNLLNAVNVIRDISSLGNSISGVISNGLKGLMSKMFGIKATDVTSNNIANTTNEGNVFNITAEFPNANSVEEIQQAILGLPTLASQFISGNN